MSTPTPEFETPTQQPKQPKVENVEEQIPDSARTVLVPIANPQTAPVLLELATSLTHGEGGRVLALIVSKDSSFEEETQSVDALTPIVEELQEQGHTIELITAMATSIARGILDSAREHGTDLIVLGVAKPVRGEAVLGTIVENVIATAPSDVLIYRQSMSKDESIKRIVIPADGTTESQVAARTGIRIAKEMDTRMEAMYAQGSHRPQFEGLAYIEKTLAECPGSERVRRTVVPASNAGQGIVSRLTKNDMVIVGFIHRNELERWMFGDFTREILNQAPGPVILVARSVGRDTAVKRWYRRVWGWIHPTLTRIEQEEMVRTARNMATFNIDYLVLIMVSAVIATLGLLLNSGAVIIGAMLVAPLMQPLIGISVGITVGNLRILRLGIFTLVIGVGSALGLAFFIGLVTPIDIITPEMAGRGNPSLLDAGVAIASGVVGAYATARKDIPSALAGVAIAAALVPPLCTVGLGVGLGNSSLAFGASILFLTNIICIILSGGVVFYWIGMNPNRYQDASVSRSMISLILLLLFATPVIGALLFLTQRASIEATVQQRLENAIAPAELYDITFDNTANPIEVMGFIRTADDISVEQVIELEQLLESAVDRDLELRLVVQRVLQVPEPEDITIGEDETAPDAESTAEATPESTESP